MTVLGLAVAALSGCAIGSIHLEKETRISTVAATPAQGVEVRTGNGRVTITADPSATEVTITAELRAQTLERLAQTTIATSYDADGDLLISVQWADSKRLNGEGCHFDIITPGQQGVGVDTSNGAIRISGLGGNAHLRSSNGAIEVLGQRGDVDADTSNGHVTITDPAGTVRAQSSNGRIEVTNAPGRVDADTSNGRIEVSLTDESAGPVIADTSNGKIVLRVGRGFRGALTMSTSNGSVSAQSLETIGGVTLVSMKKSSGKIVFGEGGEASSCSTSNGSITVEGKK